MQNEESREVIGRMFEALDYLKQAGRLRGLQTFTRRYGINRWNMVTLRKEPHRDMFELAWFTYLVRDYGISARWLLTGEGSIVSVRGGRKKESGGKNSARAPRSRQEE